MRTARAWPAIAATILAAHGLPELAAPQAPPGPRAERVVSLVPAATEALFALGAGDRVVGVGSHDAWPPEAGLLPRVGALLDPDVERIVTLTPGLVVVDPSQRALTRQLEAMGIEPFPWATADLGSLYERIRALAGRLGVADRGEALAVRIDTELRAVVPRSLAVPPPRVLLVFGRRPGSFAQMWVSGGRGFLHELIALAGGSNVFGGVELPSFKAGLEVVVAERPEVIIETRAGASAADRAVIEAEWRALPGLDSVRVGVLDSRAALVPGPRLPETARAMARIMGTAGTAPGPGSARSES